MSSFIKHVSICILSMQLCDQIKRTDAEKNADFSPTRGIMMSENAYRVQWGFTGRSPDDSITFQVQAKTLGWVGLGFSPTGGMAGADIVVAGYDEETGKGYIYDRHGKCNCFPENDAKQDYTLLRASQNDTHTSVVFSRKLSTCDPDDHAITNDTVRLIWAMGDTDAKSVDSFPKHQVNERGAKSSMLLDDGFGAPSALPEDTVHLDLLVNNVTIPADYHTLYWCKIFKLPTDWKKHHMIRFEPIIQKGHEAFLHHIVLYHCSKSMASFLDKAEACFSRDYLEFSKMNDCGRRVLSTWAVGSAGVQYKDDIGFPLMEAGASPYVLIEVHYDNSARQTPIQTDNSGIRIFLTPTLRPKELAPLMLGMGVGAKDIIIPPGQKSVKMYSKCDWSCTQYLPDEGIYINSALLHEHLIGVGVKLRHIRDGQELEPIFEDNDYDFNYQDERYLTKPRHVKQNDTMMVECTFNSLGKANVTYGGWGTPQEMCLVFVTYYPRNPKLYNCASSPTMETYADAMKTTANKRGGPKTVSEKKIPVEDYAAKYDWNSENVDYFQKKVQNGNYYIYCEGTQPNQPEKKMDEFQLAKQKAELAAINSTHSASVGEEEVFELEFSEFVPSVPLELPTKPFQRFDFCAMKSMPQNGDGHSVDSTANRQTDDNWHSSASQNSAMSIVVILLIVNINTFFCTL